MRGRAVPSERVATPPKMPLRPADASNGAHPSPPQRQTFLEQFRAERERTEMDAWAERWRERTMRILLDEVHALEFGMEEWEKEQQERERQREVQRQHERTHAIREATRLLREAELEVRAGMVRALAEGGGGGGGGAVLGSRDVAHACGEGGSLFFTWRP